MAPVQRFLDELAASLRLTCKRNTLLVQIMIAGAFGAMHAKLDQQAAYFSRRKTGADDRAMHAVMHVPDCRAPARSGRHERVARRFAGPARLHRNHAARERGRSRLEAVREDVGQQIRSAGRHAARYIPSDIANVTHNCGSGKRKERAIPVAPGASEKNAALSAGRIRHDGLADLRALKASRVWPTSSRTAAGIPNINAAAPTSSIRKVLLSSSSPILMALSGSGIAPLGGDSGSGSPCRRFASQPSASMMLTMY